MSIPICLFSYSFLPLLYFRQGGILNSGGGIDMSSMGDRIRELRKKAGLSQNQLGAKVGVEANTISRWETDKIEASHNYIVRLADVLETTTDYLLGRVGKVNMPITDTQADPQTVIEPEQNVFSKNIQYPTNANAKLVYTLKNGERLELPPTKDSYDFIAKLWENSRANAPLTFNQSYNAPRHEAAG